MYIFTKLFYIDIKTKVYLFQTLTMIIHRVYVFDKLIRSGIVLEEKRKKLQIRETSHILILI